MIPFYILKIEFLRCAAKDRKKNKQKLKTQFKNSTTSVKFSLETESVIITLSDKNSRH